jgi:hypothetical protein
MACGKTKKIECVRTYAPIRLRVDRVLGDGDEDSFVGLCASSKPVRTFRVPRRRGKEEVQGGGGGKCGEEGGDGLGSFTPM